MPSQFRLRAGIDLDGSGFQSSLNGLHEDVKSWGAKTAAALAGIFTLGFATNKFANFAQGLSNMAESTMDLADRLETTTNEVQRLQFAALQADVSIEEITAGITQLNNARQEAMRDPSGGAARAFKFFGIGQDEIALGKLNVIMQKLGGTIRANGRDSQTMAFFFDLMGRRSIAMSRFLAQDTDQLKGLADQMNAIISPQTLQLMDDYADVWTRVGLVIKKYAAEAYAFFIGFQSQTYFTIAQMGDLAKTIAALPFREGTAREQLQDYEARRMGRRGSQDRINNRVFRIDRNAPSEGLPVEFLGPEIATEKERLKMQEEEERRAERIKDLNDQLRSVKISQLSDAEKRLAIEERITELEAERAKLIGIGEDEKSLERLLMIEKLKTDLLGIREPDIKKQREIDIPTDELARIGGYIGASSPQVQKLDTIAKATKDTANGVNKLVFNLRSL